MPGNSLHHLSFCQLEGKMSRVYTDKPQRQPVYKRSSPDSSERPDEQDSLQSDSYSPQAASSHEPEIRSSSGYHVFAPDRQKQEKLKRISEAEERAAEELKEKRRHSLPSETRRLGGKQLSSEEVRERKEAEARKAKYERKFKRDEYKQKEREHRDAELRDKKKEARRKAEIQKVKESQEVNDRKDEMRKARLKRFADQ